MYTRTYTAQHHHGCQACCLQCQAHGPCCCQQAYRPWPCHPRCQVHPNRGYQAQAHPPQFQAYRPRSQACHTYQVVPYAPSQVPGLPSPVPGSWSMSLPADVPPWPWMTIHPAPCPVPTKAEAHLHGRWIVPLTTFQLCNFSM